MKKRGLTTEEKEKRIQLANEDVTKHGRKQSVAAKRRGVATSTLWGRLNDRRERHEAHAHEQLLSKEEEAELVSWCLQMKRRFLPVRLSHVVGCAESILRRRIEDLEPDVHVGNHWIERFLVRHPELQVTTNKRLDERRAMAKNPVNIMEFYVMLSYVHEKYGILPANVFNMDEEGYMLGMIGKEKVVILRRGHRNGYAGGAKHNGNRETITTIDGICGDGTVLPTMIIMKEIYVQTTWLENSPLEPETRWACSPTGWTNNKLGVEYIKAFDKWTRDKSAGGKWRCLILNGHGSHLTFEFLQYAWEARIIVVGLPSHTTDFLQPLDVALFRPMQRFYGQAVENRARRMLAVTKASFAELLYQTREKAYTRENILSGFESTGICPLDAYRTQVMQNFRAKMQAANQAPTSSEETQPALRRRRRRRALTAKAQDLTDNKESSPRSFGKH